MSNIVISGYYGSKNAGDEAMLAAMIEVLSDLDPKVNITVISANPQDTMERHGVQAISWLGIPAIWAALGKADLLLSGGGSLLQNVTSRRSLYYYMGIIFLAFMARVPVMLYAQGIGPIRGHFARRIMAWIGSMRTVRLWTSDHCRSTWAAASRTNRPSAAAHQPEIRRFACIRCFPAYRPISRREAARAGRPAAWILRWVAGMSYSTRRSSTTFWAMSKIA